MDNHIAKHPLSEGVVIWKENFFMHTVNIYEQRGPKFLCTECNDVFNTRLSIITHSKIHLKSFCVVCGLYTTTAQQMQKHMKNFHRSLVRIIPIQMVDINKLLASKPVMVKNTSIEQANAVEVNQQHETINKEVQERIKKKKIKACKTISFSRPKNGYTPLKHMISRFGRCISVKTPVDY